jgi:anaerobic ribonucleoside-triphosphate reductase activating protein
MLIDRFLYPVYSLGPGRRLVIWTVGCSKRCAGCTNSELWTNDETKEIDADELFAIISSVTRSREVDGFTLTGGDPLEQPRELIKLLRSLRTLSDDILVYTGFTLGELEETMAPEEMSDLKEFIGVLIDGRYEESLNDNAVPLRGSSNQNTIFFNENLRERYEFYMSAGRKMQNVFFGKRIMPTGIHNKYS